MEREGKLMAKCTKCGQEFEKTRAEQYRCRYCLREYKASYIARKMHGLPPISRTCVFCGKYIEGKRLYVCITTADDKKKQTNVRPRKPMCQKCADLFIEKLWGEQMNITVDRPAAKIGEYVKHKKAVRKIMGYAIGDDGRDCYDSMSAEDGYGWRTHLTPMDEVTDKYVRMPIDEVNNE